MSDATMSLGLLQSGYALVLPLALFGVFLLFYIPAMMVTDAKPMAVGQAIVCYIMKTLGILLMTTSILPLLYSLMNNTVPQDKSLYSLLLVFVVGLGILVHFSSVSQKVDEPSVVVIRSIFSHGFEVLGMILAVFSGLTLMLQFLLTESFQDWQMPATMLVVGLMFSLLFSLHISERKKGHAKRMVKKTK